MLLLGATAVAVAVRDVARQLVPEEAAAGGECLSRYWQEAHRAPGPSGHVAVPKPQGGYMPSQAGEAWANLRRADDRKAHRVAHPSALVAGAQPASCVALPGTAVDDNWCQTNCLQPMPNCPSTACKCESGSPSQESQASGDQLSPTTEVARSHQTQQQQAPPEQPAAQREQEQQQQPVGTWTAVEHVNCCTVEGCYNKGGAPGEPLQVLDTDVGSLADCKAACEEAPACQAVVVKGPRREGDVTACYLRDQVDVQECASSEGFGLFTLDRQSLSSPAAAAPAAPEEPPPTAPAAATVECKHLLPVNVSDVDVTTDETAAAKEHTPKVSEQLDAMRHRAKVLKSCQAAERWSRPSPSRLQLRGDPGLAASKTEVIVCPGARLAFIHVYKAAGTTIIASLHDLCQAMGSEARLICGHDGEKKWPVLQGDDQMWCDQTLAEAWDDIANYSFFTFVRDPVERFGSGLFENAYRASQSNYSTCASQAGDSKEGIEGDELALAVLDRCLRWIEPDADILDPHLKPQIDFFLQADQSVLPQLEYIGHVETMTDDWPALVGKFFGKKAGAQVKKVMQRGALKVRSEDSDQYHVDGLDPKFYNLKMGESTRRTIADAFLIDEVCLGYSTEMFLDDADMPQRRSDVP